MRKQALLRRPSPRLAEGIVTHLDRVPVDTELAFAQWEAYREVLHAQGWQTLEVEPEPDCPDSGFVEDSVVVYGNLAILARSGAPERRPETTGTEKALRALGYTIARIEEPGVMDGGDVLKHGGTVWVGQGGRTNAVALEQMTSLLSPLGARVVGVPLTKVLHLKSAVTALPDGTVIGFEPFVDDPQVYPAFQPVPEDAGAHVVVLDERTVLISSAAPRTIELLAARGLTVVTVDISEFEKLEGCVTCLSVRLRG